MDWIINKLVMLPGVIIGISFHEWAHAAMANRLGDPTPKEQGRLTINPLAHIDWVGFIVLLLCGFGWGRNIVIDPSNFKHQRRDQFLVSIAGITTNLILAYIFSIFTKVAMGKYMETGSMLMQTLFLILYYTVIINLVLMIFNLLPVPPLDGFGIVTQIFNLEKKSWYWKLYTYGTPVLLFLIIFNVTDKIITPLISFFTALMGL